MSNFADSLIARSLKTKSVLTAGIDPNIDLLPKCIVSEVERSTQGNDDFIYGVLTKTYIPSLEAISNSIAACKPNIAFFEQYGVAGLRAYSDILLEAKNLQIPSIADAKRGDIGSTAQAYAAAFLGQAKVRGEKISAFEADALTVNPYLGADTLECFVAACEQHGKGLFVLVRTSNPGSTWLQEISQNNESVAEKVAAWIYERGSKLVGHNGFSSLGAVVGATHPAEAKKLRAIMKNNIFLIPGFGAQGGGAKDAVAGFANMSLRGSGSTVNVSRGLFQVFAENFLNLEEMKQALKLKIDSLNLELNAEIPDKD